MRDRTEKQILNIFKVHRGVLISAILIVDRLDLTYDTVAKHLKIMVAGNKVKRIGVGKPWRYYYYLTEDATAKRQVLAMKDAY